MFSEVAPTIHHILCTYMNDCTYSNTDGAQLIWIQERPPNIPQYIMLDSITDTFKCLSPYPIVHKDDPAQMGRPIVLRKAVVGVPPDVRVFHNWETDLKTNWREPAKDDMIVFRKRIADCFGFDFQQNTASTDPLRILFINRHYEEGRSILNAHKIAHFMQKMPELEAFPDIEFTIHYLEGDESIRYQAELFWNASLLIWPHGATMAHTFFLPRKAEAIEVIPWCQEDKANLPEWVQAIRDAFSLDINLHVVQNKDRSRQMFNHDKMLEYEEYRRMSSDQKIALLETGECPEGIDPFLCPFWWNHWKVSVNLDWKELQPVVRTALLRLQALREGGDPDDYVLNAPKRKRNKKNNSANNRSLAKLPPVPHPKPSPQVEELFEAPVARASNGVPLSSFTCVHDQGIAATRLCMFQDLVIHGGKIYYVTETPEADDLLPQIQIAWEDWIIEADVKGNRYFEPEIVSPFSLPFPFNGSSTVEVVERAALAHQVDTGNFYHLLSEVLPTYFANWCAHFGFCSLEDRSKYQILFIQPDPHGRFGIPAPVKEILSCFSDKPDRKITDESVANSAIHVRHAMVGIGPYLRAYDSQEWTKKWSPPAAGLMPLWRHFISECTGTGFADASAPEDKFQITIINRPYSSGRSFLNLPEIMDWIAGEWLPAQNIGRPFDVTAATLRESQPIAEQIRVLQNTNLLIYPHGATMAHAIFLPRGSAVLEVIPWPNVTEPHGWLESIHKQYELDIDLHVMVNDHRENLVLNWHALSKDPDWVGLPAESKVALQEKGICPLLETGLEGKCMFEWLHWRSELVLHRGQLAVSLKRILGRLKEKTMTSV